MKSEAITEADDDDEFAVFILYFIEILSRQTQLISVNHFGLI